MAELQVGDVAPDFTAVAHDGRTISLRDYRGHQVVVLYFYPRDGTPVCTREACSFRDAYEDFVTAGAVVIGVSGNTRESHERFARERELPFILLADTDGTLRKQYGSADWLSLVPRRVTFVIDREGIIRLVFSALWSADLHVVEALRVVQSLGASPPVSPEA